MLSSRISTIAFTVLCLATCASLNASEHLLGYVSGAEPLPQGTTELEGSATLRAGKGKGRYRGINSTVGAEHGITDRFAVGIGLQGQRVATSGLIIDAYIPEEKTTPFQLSGAEAEAKYNVLSAAKDGLGLTLVYGLDFSWVDPHSGQKKNTLSAEYGVALQSYFFDGELIWLGNIGLETTIADRKEIPDLDPAIEWPTDPEVEAEGKIGTGLSYRIVSNWFIGGEALYEAEHETEVGEERWSVFAGPSLHFAQSSFWATATWLPQIRGGGEQYPDQKGDLHLIEKTKHEFRLRIGTLF